MRRICSLLILILGLLSVAPLRVSGQAPICYNTACSQTYSVSATWIENGIQYTCAKDSNSVIKEQQKACVLPDGSLLADASAKMQGTNYYACDLSANPSLLFLGGTGTCTAPGGVVITIPGSMQSGSYVYSCVYNPANYKFEAQVTGCISVNGTHINANAVKSISGTTYYCNPTIPGVYVVQGTCTLNSQPVSLFGVASSNNVRYQCVVQGTGQPVLKAIGCVDNSGQAFAVGAEASLQSTINYCSTNSAGAIFWGSRPIGTCAFQEQILQIGSLINFNNEIYQCKSVDSLTTYVQRVSPCLATTTTTPATTTTAATTTTTPATTTTAVTTTTTPATTTTTTPATTTTTTAATTTTTPATTTTTPAPTTSTTTTTEATTTTTTPVPTTSTTTTTEATTTTSTPATTTTTTTPATTTVATTLPPVTTTRGPLATTTTIATTTRATTTTTTRATTTKATTTPAPPHDDDDDDHHHGHHNDDDDDHDGGHHGHHDDDNDDHDGGHNHDDDHDGGHNDDNDDHDGGHNHGGGGRGKGPGCH